MNQSNTIINVQYGDCGNPTNAEATFLQSIRMQRFLKNI